MVMSGEQPEGNEQNPPGLMPIQESETRGLEDLKEEKRNEHGANVTYRERLGGYLHPRDMRKLVTPFSASNEPELIVRRHAMLLNFDTLRAIILRDRLLVLVPDGADSLLVELEKRIRGDVDFNDRNSQDYGNTTSSLDDESDDDHNSDEKSNQSSVVKNILSSIGRKKRRHREQNATDVGKTPEATITLRMESELSDDPLDRAEHMHDSFVEHEWEEMEGKEWIDLPFELQSVDAVLHSVCAVLADDVLDLQLDANAVISDLLSSRSDLGDHAQEVLRNMKNALKEMTSRVQGFCRALDVVLEDGLSSHSQFFMSSNQIESTFVHSVVVKEAEHL